MAAVKAEVVQANAGQYIPGTTQKALSTGHFVVRGGQVCYGPETATDAKRLASELNASK